MRRLVLLFILLLPLGASASSFSSLYVFGDSLSDPGNIPLVSGYDYPPAPYSANRFSNGKVAAQYLAPLLGLPLNNADNYAQGGATTGYTNNENASSGGPILNNTLSGTLGQVGNYLGSTGGAADPNALYMVWAGPNDFLPGLSNPLTFDFAAAATQAVTNLATAVGTLEAAGARHFLVPNMPDLGMTPRVVGTVYQSFATQLAAQFDQSLGQSMATLAASLGVDITTFDTFGFMDGVLADPSAYGFTNVTQACLSGSTVCSTPDSYLFWDAIHPTTHGHQLLAQAMAADVAPVPVPAALPLFLSGLGVLVGMRRRRAA